MAGKYTTSSHSKWWQHGKDKPKTYQNDSHGWKNNNDKGAGKSQIDGKTMNTLGLMGEAFMAAKRDAEVAEERSGLQSIVKDELKEFSLGKRSRKKTPSPVVTKNPTVL